MVTQSPAPDSTDTTPTLHTIISALELCYLCQDTHSALRIAAMILGGSQGRPTRPRGATNSLSFPVRAWEYLLHLAATKGGQDQKRDCLELLNAHGLPVLDVWKSTSAIERFTPLEKRVHIYIALHIVQVLKTVWPSSDAADPEAWSDIRKRAESFLALVKARRQKS
jgi:hypothetical protein